MPDYVISVGTGKGEDPALVHVPEGQRGYVGEQIAEFADWAIRNAAIAGGRPMAPTSKDKLCPGCYMSVMLNALIKLAKDNGQEFSYIASFFRQALFDLERDGVTVADARARVPQPQVGNLQAGIAKTLVASVRASRADADDYDKYVDDFWLGYVPGMGDPLTFEEFVALPKRGECLATSRYEAYEGLLSSDDLGSPPAPACAVCVPPYKDLSPSDAIAALKGTWPDNSAAS